jgi:hypothetical protein
MKSAPQSSDGDKPADKEADKQSDRQSESAADPHTHQHPRTWQEAAAPLPHESDQSPESQHEEGARHVGKQAHRDLERGLQDTDRRGGDEYQQQTQNDAHADVNSDNKPDGAGQQRKP